MAAWFSATDTSLGGAGTQLYQLGTDESVKEWTASIGSGSGLDPFDLTFFNNALWFSGQSHFISGKQLYKLGSDGSVTQWTATVGLHVLAEARSDSCCLVERLGFGVRRS